MFIYYFYSKKIKIIYIVYFLLSLKQLLSEFSYLKWFGCYVSYALCNLCLYVIII